MESVQSLEGELLGLRVDEVLGVDDLSGVVHLRVDVNGGEAVLGLGGGSSDSLATVALLSGEGQTEDSSEMFFGLFLTGRDTDGGSGVGRVVEASEGSGRVGPLLSLELNQVGIVFTGEGPDDGSRSTHTF